MAIGTFLAINTVTITNATASSIKQTPKAVRFTTAQNEQTENPLLRKYATITGPDGDGSGRGCGMDWDGGGRGGHWWW